MAKAQASRDPQGGWPLKNYLRRNFILGVMCSGFLSLGMTLTNDNMALALFVKRLGASNAVVGLLLALRFGCWLWGLAEPKELPRRGWAQGKEGGCLRETSCSERGWKKLERASGQPTELPHQG